MIAAFDAESGSFHLLTTLHEKHLAQQVPGAAWRERLLNPVTGSNGAWAVAASWPAYVAINGIFAHTLQPDETYRAWGQTAWETRYRPLTELRFQSDAHIGDGPTAARLWPLQRVAVQTMVWAERYLELDDMGGGKTATTLAALRLAAAVHGEDAVFPALVVCPNKVRRSWRKIALEDLGDGQGGAYPDLRLEVMPKGKAAQTKTINKFLDLDGGDPQVLITNWESLRTLSRLEAFGQIVLTDKERAPGLLNEIPWRTIIADEAHRIKDRRAKQTRALKAIANGTPDTGTPAARFRWLLTGTPIANNSAELWSLLNFADPVAWPAYTRFIDRYATNTYNGFGGFEIGGLNPNTTEEFHAAFLPGSIRRLREQFDPFKPKVVRQTLTVPMETKQAKAYSDLAKDMLAKLETGVLTATDALSRANRLRQLAQAFGEMVDLGRRDPITGEAIMDLQLRAPSNKVETMLEILDDFDISARAAVAESPRSIVFGAPSRQLIGLCEEALKKAKIPYTLIAGQMKDAEQEMHERNFELGNTRVALCVTSAAKEGINSLVRADTLVHLQKSDSRNDNVQFEGRIDRPGQKAGSITILDVVSEGTYEEFEQVEALERKYEHFQQIVADARVLQAMLQFKGGEA